MVEKFRDIQCRWPMLWLAIAAAVGIFLDHWLTPAVSVWISIFTVIAVACIVVRPGHRGLLVAVLILPLFSMRHSAQRQQYESASIVQLLGTDSQPVIIEATIDRAAQLQPHPMAGYVFRRDQSPWQTEFECRLDRIKVGDEFIQTSGRVVVVVDGACDERTPGERVRLFGTLRVPMEPSNPGERDLRDSYRQRNLHARLSLTGGDQLEVIEPAPWSISGSVAELARQSREILLNQTAESTGGLAVALVIGQRDFVDPVIQDLLLITGTAHLLSVSGLHLAIVVLLARWIGIGLRFPPAMQLLHITAVSVFYAMITGGRPPVLRAAILVGLLVLSMVTRRPSQAINTLSLAAVMLLAWKPILLFNVGVQLSFLAVATLMLCGNRTGSPGSSIENIAEKEERLLELAESSSPQLLRWIRRLGQYATQGLWYSGCVTLISMPLVWHQFHVVSPISILTNVFMSLPMTIALASGIATVMVGMFSETLAIIPGAVCDVSLSLMLTIIRFFAAIPVGHAWLPSPSTWMVILFYCVIAFSLVIPPNRHVRMARFAWIMSWMCVAWWIATTGSSMHDTGDAPTKIEATFVDVGHGTAVVMRFAEDDVWLYDCGRLGNSVTSSADVDAVLWSLGVTHLTGVVISHADIDHYNALPAILRRFGVDRVYTSASVFDDPDPLLQNLKRQIDSLAIPVVNLHRGMNLVSGGVTLQVLHPPVQRIEGSDNANSLVLAIDAGSTPLILPGDLEPPGTEGLLWQARPRGGGVLMAPHHGSLQLDMRPILDWSRAGFVIVSGGERAARPEVHEALAVTGSIVLVTAQSGAIRVRIDELGRVRLRSWLDDP